MSVLGKISEFDPAIEDFETYVERLKLFMTANDIADAKKVPVFLSCIGPRPYKLLKSLLTPEKPEEKGLESLIDTLKSHYAPKPVVISERFKFYQRVQREGESISSYAAELKNLTVYCEFGDFLNQALRDKFVCGLRNTATQKKLLSEEKLTFDGALKIAVAMETAERNTKDIKGELNQDGSGIHRLSQGPVNAGQRKSKQYPNSKNPQSQKSPRTSHQNQPSGQTGQSVKKKVLCPRCRKGPHPEYKCRYRNFKCRKCGEIGHLEVACGSSSIKFLEAQEIENDDNMESQEESDKQDPFSLFHMSSSKSDKCIKPIEVCVNLSGQDLDLEVDTGSEMTLVPIDIYEKKFSELKLQPCAHKFYTYNNQQVPTVGQLDVEVKYKGQSCILPIVIVDVRNQSPVLGRNWLYDLKLDWKGLLKVFRMSNGKTDFSLKYPEVFQEGLGTVKGYKARIYLKENSTPIFKKARPVPFALKSAVDKEIDRLEADGVLVKVNHSDWASPIVVVPKADGGIRICADFKVSINQCIDVDRYPLPTTEELFACLTGGKYFSKLDLTSAYQQLIVEEDSQFLLTVNTHKGLYKYTRLPFGMASAPAIFQSNMDQILNGLPGVICYLDDILITGSSKEEHNANLEAVLVRLRDHGLHVKLSKCKFLEQSVEYLGHCIDSEGIRPSPSKIAAIQNMTVPSNVTELRAFLGIIHYYNKFIPNLSSQLQPLNELLRKGVTWKWSKECEKVFRNAQKALTADTLLTHYDSTKSITLSCDASAKGLGAVISNIQSDTSEKPIAYASRTLNKAECNYSQIEKEALAIIFGLKKFHKYLYGRSFILSGPRVFMTSSSRPNSGGIKEI